MRIFRNGVLRGAALLALLVLVALPSALADDAPPPPFDPLEARIKPPGGLTSQASTGSLSGEPTKGTGTESSEERLETEARIRPPGGITEPGMVELLIQWLRVRLLPIE